MKEYFQTVSIILTEGTSRLIQGNVEEIVTEIQSKSVVAHIQFQAQFINHFLHSDSVLQSGSLQHKCNRFCQRTYKASIIICICVGVN